MRNGATALVMDKHIVKTNVLGVMYTEGGTENIYINRRHTLISLFIGTATTFRKGCRDACSNEVNMSQLAV